MQNVVSQVDSAFLYIIGFSFALLLGITAAMIYFLFRYRKDRNPVPADIRSNARLELVWTAVPTLIALSMFYVGWQSFIGLRGVPKDAMDVGVTGMQWTWVFTYPNGKRSESLMEVPLGKPVKLTIRSLDVIHGFYSPAFRIKMDALPNMNTYAWFYAARQGDYVVFCSQYCGEGHAEMSATIRVVPENEYLQWLRKK